jgi:hypothetical protein
MPRISIGPSPRLLTLLCACSSRRPPALIEMNKLLGLDIRRFGQSSCWRSGVAQGLVPFSTGSLPG